MLGSDGIRTLTAVLATIMIVSFTSTLCWGTLEESNLVPSILHSRICLEDRGRGKVH